MTNKERKTTSHEFAIEDVKYHFERYKKNNNNYDGEIIQYITKKYNLTPKDLNDR